MKLLIDTNVILDMVLNRENCRISMDLFRKIRGTRVKAYITASSVTDLFYIIHKETHNTSQTYVVIENIFKLVKILPVTDKDILDAFQKKWKDFEDCVQYMTGENNDMDYIVTVNKKDYKDALLPVLTPTECLARLP